VPEAVTVNVAVSPLAIVVEEGCVVMLGAVATVTVARVESTLPAALLMRTQ
jgi:hypothetical protein